jgi:uncharacterized protein
MDPERISFPADYPIKVIARSEEGLRERVDAVFVRHFGPLSAEQVQLRPSAESRFMALTYQMRVEGETQLAALHQELKGTEGVIMVL